MAKKLAEDEKSFLRMLAEKDELDDGDCMRALQFFSDADGWQREQLEKREKQRSNAFLTRMSHDIRTPLNGIVGMLEIAEKNKDNIELMHDCFEKIRMSVSNLLLLINDILDMHKLESGKIEMESDSFDLNELVVNATEMVLPLARAHNVSLRVVSMRGLRHPYLIGTSGYIRQIYTNLVTNAIKYNKPNGAVHIEVDELTSDEENEKGVFRFTVEDTGIGMSEKFLERVFDPYTQERKDSRTTYHGSGLGLSICKKLIDLMGGTVEVTSKQGEGSRFVVVLPIEIDRSPEAKEHHAETERINLAGLHVLLVEDNELNAEIALYMLGEMGAEVVWAENGQVAMDWFKKSEPDEIGLILMDLMMPVKNGIETARELRALPREDAKAVPIIAMTANALESDVKSCMDAGMNAHMAKPFDSATLYRKIREFVTLPTELKEEKPAVHVELHKELRYGLTAAEKNAGMKEYNHPLFMSQQYFMTACWEINTARASIAILKSTLHAQLTGRQTGYERLFEKYANENVAPQDVVRWRENLSLEALRALRGEKHLVLSMGSKEEGYRDYDIVLVPSFDAAGKTEVVYYSAAETR